jgi:enoyl-CoA hydratase/carnithine racemase
MLWESAVLEVSTSYGIATARFRSGASWRAVALEMAPALSILETNPGIDVVVMRGFAHLPSHAVATEAFSGDDAFELARMGQRIAGRISRLPVPSVAHLDGPCRGPALELALSCTWRTASGHAGTRLSFPRGSSACWGGTQRLPRLIGRPAALAMLSGAAAPTGGEALRIGLVHRAWPANMAEVFLMGLELDLQVRPRRPVRPWRRVRPAAPVSLDPWAADAVDRGLKYGMAEGLAAERRWVSMQSRKRHARRAAA